MGSHRSLRMAEAIREVVASSILFEAADPRIRAVTVLRVEVSADLHNATAFVSIMGDEAERNQSMRGLSHATGFFQSKVAARLQTRFTPVLTFKLDESVKKSIEISRLIDEAMAADREPRGPGPHEPAEPDPGLDEPAAGDEPSGASAKEP